jgi:hypothetical protein
MRRTPLVLLAFLLVSTPLHAQGVSPWVKYGKWVLVAGAVAMNYLALDAHNNAEDSFDALEARCLEDHTQCTLGPDGTYVDPVSEELYQTTLHYDGVARNWLIGGESALVGAAALFVWELTRPKGRPENVPFQPEFRRFGRSTGVGLRFEF